MAYLTYGQWRDLEENGTFLSGIAALSPVKLDLASSGPPNFVNALYVSRSFFRTLGLDAAEGRLLAADDDGAQCASVAVVGAALSQRLFGGSSPVDRHLRVAGHLVTIVGLTPRGFVGVDAGRVSEVFLPLCLERTIAGRLSLLENTQAQWLTVLGRKPGDLSNEVAEARLASVQRVSPDVGSPTARTSQPWRLVPASSGISSLRPQYEAPLAVLVILSSSLLAIAAVNVAGLLWLNTARRHQEFAIRRSVGATSSRVATQLFLESAVLGGCAVVIGLLAAIWAGEVLTARLGLHLNLRMADREVASMAIAMTGLLATVTATPAVVYAIRADLSRRPVSYHPPRASNVVALTVLALQIAMSLPVLYCAGLLTSTFVDLSKRDIGVHHRSVALLTVTPRMDRDPSTTGALQDRLLNAVRALPMVESAALSQITPLAGRMLMLPVGIPGAPSSAGRTAALANVVSQDYFRTIGTPVLAGRDIDTSDMNTDEARVVVNEAFARLYFPGSNPVGRTLYQEVPEGVRQFQVVGLAADAVYHSLRDTVPPTVFIAANTFRRGRMDAFTLVARPASGGAHLLRDLERTVGSVEPTARLEARYFSDDVLSTLVQERALAWLSSIFGTLGVALCAIGTFGTCARAVRLRRRELAVRSALGATPRHTMWTIARPLVQVWVLAVTGGAAASWLTARSIRAVLFGVSPWDPGTMTVGLVVLAGAVGAAALPLIARAGRPDIASLLRSE